MCKELLIFTLINIDIIAVGWIYVKNVSRCVYLFGDIVNKEFLLTENMISCGAHFWVSIMV